MPKYSEYIVRRSDYAVSFQFIEAEMLPDLPITTPFTFPFLDGNVLLVLDKNGWWNPLGGHIEPGEAFLAALKREAWEEGGVEINGIKLIGYVEAKIIEGTSSYPERSILPFTISNIVHYDEGWVKRETLDRKVFTIEEARKALQLRDDNHQIEEVFEYAVKCQKL